MSKTEFIIFLWVLLAIYTFFKTSKPRKTIAFLNTKVFSLEQEESHDKDREKILAYKRQIQKEFQKIYIAIVIYVIIAIIFTMLVINT